MVVIFIMESIRKWFYKPRRDDPSLLSQFFYADEELNLVAAELDSFDGRKDPERCTLLVNHLRQCQDKVLTICSKIMEELIPDERAERDFRVKFPDDVMQDNLAGQLWFGAECLAAGSSIMNRELESGAMRPLAKALTKSLENVRNLLREAALRMNVVLPPNDLSHDRLVESLKMFDRLLAQFELAYVSAMVPVKSIQEYELQQCVIVLFSETLKRALSRKLLDQEMVDQYDPALMFTIPRLAIVAGLLIYPEGPLSLDDSPNCMSELFRPFRTLLMKIRELLWSLNENELLNLEKMLCSSDEVIPESKDCLNSGCIGELSDSETYKENIKKVSTCLESKDPTVVNMKDNVKDMEENVHENSISANYAVKDEDSNSYNSLLDSRLNTNQSNSNSDSSSDKSPNNSQLNMSGGISDINDSDISDKRTNIPSISSDSENLCDKVSSSCTSKCSNRITDTDIDIPVQLPSTPVDYLNLNNHWTLPVIPCSCSHFSAIEDEPNITHQGLINRGVSHEDEAFTTQCTSCIPYSRHSSETICNENNDVRWSNENPGPSENIQTSSTNLPSQSVIFNDRTLNILDSSNVILQNGIVNPVVSCDNSNNKNVIKLNGNIKSSRLTNQSNNDRNSRGEPSVDLHMRYADNWQALQKSSENSHGRSPSKFGYPASSSISTTSSSCSSYNSISSVQSDSYSISSETTSFNSDCQDEEEVALALKAAQTAIRQTEARARFSSSTDLVHRLFVCIAGVADQLQTNFAGELRNILKSVFQINATNKTELEEILDENLGECCENGEEALIWGENEANSVNSVESPPPWVPDEASPSCMACQAQFTVVRRRHHCRNCGKIFCARCSSNSVPLPRFGHLKPVRVCNRCFIYQLTPFTINQFPTSVS